MARRPGDPLITDTTVSVSRSGVPIAGMQHIEITIKAATAMNINPDGIQVTTDLVSGTGPSAAPDVWRVGDVLTIEAAGYQITKYTVVNTQPPHGLLKVWRIRIGGVIQ